MRAFTFLTLSSALLACSSDISDRDLENAAVRAIKVDANLKLAVDGGSILKFDRKQNPPVAYVRSQSFDLRIETIDQGCEPRAITFVISNLPKEGVQPTVRVLLNAQTPEAIAASQALGGGLTLKADPHSDNTTPITTDIAYELEQTDNLYTVTVVSDRNRMSADLLPGRPGVLDSADGACARLTNSGQGDELDEAALILRQRLHVDPPEEGFAFAVFGNTQSHKKALATIIDQINAEDDIAFTVISGDLYGSGSFYSLDDLTKKLNRLQNPWFATLGEKDIEARNSQTLITHFGQSSFAFDWTPLRLIVLDSASATFSSETHSLLENWLTREPLYWTDTPKPATLAVITHYAPFDPHGARNDGFKHRLEAAHVIANLERAQTELLLTSHLATFSTEHQGDVQVVHAGGGGASMENNKSHFWIRVDVDGSCAREENEENQADTSCEDCESGQVCKSGVCQSCLKITKKPF